MAKVERVFLLPDLGEGLTSGEILDCRIKLGEQVEADQLAMVIETAKTCIDVPLPFGGAVIQIHCKVGDIVPVGEPLVTVLTDEASQTDGVQINHLVGRRQGTTASSDSHTVPLTRRLPPKANMQHVAVSPAVRRLARQLEISLATVVGTGKGGVITLDDVQAKCNAA